MDELSKDFADALFREFPDWRPLARVERLESGADFLVVEVPPPSTAAVDSPLVVTTQGEEVSVFFDHWHTHFGWPTEMPVPNLFEDPIIFLRELVTERIVIAVWHNGQEWRGSSAHPVDDLVSKPDEFKPVSEVRIRSWRGTFNRDPGHERP